MNKRLDGIKESCDKINAYVVHLGGDYAKIFEKVKLEKLNNDETLEGKLTKHFHDNMERKRRLASRHKKSV